MLKKIIFSVLLFSQVLIGQNYVKGKMNPANDQYTWIILYQLKGAKQVYIKNASLQNGEFKIPIPATAPAGMYRLMYKVNQKSQVDFIYNKQNVEVTFDPENPAESVKFIVSDENKLYSNYLKQSMALQHQLDSLQLEYLNDNSQEKNISNLYTKTLVKYQNIQQEYKIKSKGLQAQHFIIANQIYFPAKLLKTPQEFLNSKKQHYFDFINFKDEVLKNSIFITEKVIDYEFYLSVADDVEVQNKLYEKSINEIVKKTGDDIQLESDILTTVLYNFSKMENAALMEYILTNFYTKLPKEFQNAEVIKEANIKLKLAIGKAAPDFSWQEKGVTKKLSTLNTSAKYYLLIFWSTTCSHCLHEIPLVYNFTKQRKDIHVIGFNMENDDVGFKKYAAMYPEWTNILGLKKWQNKVARIYEIHATPTYFILDRDKKIVAKPNHLEDVKSFFKD